MPCGKRPLVKNWDKPRTISVVKPSKYEQKEPSVKQHWRNAIKNLEASCKEDNFWETQRENVQELVNPIIFERLKKIFHLPNDQEKYSLSSNQGSIVPSVELRQQRNKEQGEVQIETEKVDKYSLSDFGLSIGTINVETVRDNSTTTDDALSTSKSFKVLRTAPKHQSKYSIKSFPKSTSRIIKRHSSYTSHPPSVIFNNTSEDSLETSASSNDDLEVQVPIKRKNLSNIKNVHYQLLYCSKSETDMISWKSKYRKKIRHVSSSEEYSKQAEITTRKIASEFYEWWANLGSIEYKSEIKSPENVEELFQIWLDEHVSTALVIDPKIMPCVLKAVAEAVGYPKSSCPKVLKKQIALDIKAEKSPPRVAAFGTSLPQKKKHIPPNNETRKTWHGVAVSEDLRTMACVWDDISHLTSTKSYYQWLVKRPGSKVPTILQDLYGEHETRRRTSLVVPSDFLITQAHSSTQQLQLPVSQFNLDMKVVLEKLRDEM